MIVRIPKCLLQLHIQVLFFTHSVGWAIQIHKKKFQSIVREHILIVLDVVRCAN